MIRKRIHTSLGSRTLAVFRNMRNCRIVTLKKRIGGNARLKWLSLDLVSLKSVLEKHDFLEEKDK